MTRSVLNFERFTRPEACETRDQIETPYRGACVEAVEHESPFSFPVVFSSHSTSAPAMWREERFGLISPKETTATEADRRWMGVAVEQARLCPPSDGAFSVGAVIVGEDGQEISRGYSREDDPHYHAEESALKKLLPGDPRPATATIYSTLEPCSQRKSSPVTCTQLILDAGIRRVVVAWREPATFVADCQGCELLEQAGRVVVEVPEFDEAAMEPNRHLQL